MESKAIKKDKKNKLKSNALGITLVKKNGQGNNNQLISPSIQPTNVEGHYPRFMLPGAVNLVEEDRREMSIILESFLPQLDKIGIQLNDINNLIREIITSTETFRRLKGISQIELLPFAFKQVPWYTRYTHSCLTYAFADYLLDRLNPQINLNAIELEAAKLCFLIHDLGHGPFSHLTERAFKKPKGRSGKIPKEYDHEYWTMILLNELQDSLFDTNINPYLPKNTIEIPKGTLKKSKEYNLEIFSKALSMISQNSNPIISQLLSSQIDLDRLSNYLGDRLIVSGVLEEERKNAHEKSMIMYLSSYNDTVENIKRIINNFVIIDKDTKGNHCEKYLAIHENALTPVIHFLLDRHIIRYYLLKHYRREAANNILEKILLRAQYLVKNKDIEGLGRTDLLVMTWLNGSHTESEFIEMDDQLVFNQIRKWAKNSTDPILKDLTLRFTAHDFFSTYSCQQNDKPKQPDDKFLNTIKEKINRCLKIKGIPKGLISDYYFTYDETTSEPYHVNKDEVLIYTSGKKVKKLSDYIKETNHELGLILLNTQFERYLVIAPSEIAL